MNEKTLVPDETGTKQKIIDAACHEFAEFGLAGARVDHIAQRAGVNKAMIYYHFTSKELLYREVVTSFFQSVFSRLRARTAEGSTLEEFLLALLDVHAQAYRESPDFVRILLRELASPQESLLPVIADAIRSSQFPAGTVERFKAAAEAGQFRNVDPRQALISLVTMSLGYLLLAPLMDRILNISDRSQFIEERKHAIVDLFLHGVMAT